VSLAYFSDLVREECKRPLTLVLLVAIIVGGLKVNSRLDEIERRTHLNWSLFDEKIQSEKQERWLRTYFARANISIDREYEWPDPITTIKEQVESKYR
jgi:hypothetical protein